MSASLRPKVKINFLNKFCDQPIGAELDLEMTFMEKSLQISMQYMFA